MSSRYLGPTGLLAMGTVALGISTLGDRVAAQEKPDVDRIVRQFHANHSNNEVEKNGALVADNLVVHLNGGAENKVNGATFRGRDEFVAWLKRDKVMFSDGAITDHEVIVSGNMAAIRFTLVGTHTGSIPTPNGLLEPTGRKVRIDGTEFLTFDSTGKLIRLETLTNDLGVVGQLTAK
jgi:ketosteroid isomerase-like protein